MKKATKQALRQMSDLVEEHGALFFFAKTATESNAVVLEKVYEGHVSFVVNSRESAG